jgi:hypothetical protein
MYETVVDLYQESFFVFDSELCSSCWELESDRLIFIIACTLHACVHMCVCMRVRVHADTDAHAHTLGATWGTTISHISIKHYFVNVLTICVHSS